MQKEIRKEGEYPFYPVKIKGEVMRRAPLIEIEDEETGVDKVIFDWDSYGNDVIVGVSDHNPHIPSVNEETPHRKQWKKNWYRENRERILKAAKEKKFNV